MEDTVRITSRHTNNPILSMDINFLDRRIVSCGSSNKVCIWKPNVFGDDSIAVGKDNLLSDVIVHQTNINSVMWSHSGLSLGLCTDDAVEVWEEDWDGFKYRCGFTQPSSGFVWTIDDRNIISYHRNTLFMWNISSHSCVFELDIDSNICSAACDPIGVYLYCLTEKNFLVYKIGDNKLEIISEEDIIQSDSINRISCSPDGLYISIPSYNSEQSVSVIRRDQDEQFNASAHFNGHTNRVNFSSWNKRIFKQENGKSVLYCALSDNKSISIWSSSRSKALFIIPNPLEKDQITSLIWDNSGNVLYASSLKGVVLTFKLSKIGEPIPYDVVKNVLQEKYHMKTLENSIVTGHVTEKRRYLYRSEAGVFDEKSEESGSDDIQSIGTESDSIDDPMDTTPSESKKRKRSSSILHTPLKKKKRSVVRPSRKEEPVLLIPKAHDGTIFLNETDISITVDSNRTKIEKLAKEAEEAIVLWEDYVNSKCVVATSNQYFTALGCSDGTLYVFSPKGRRIMPCIVLGPNPIYQLVCNENLPLLLCVEGSGKIYLWDIDKRELCYKSNLKKLSHLIRNETLHHIILDDNGNTIIFSSNGQAFSYDKQMNCWMRIADTYLLSHSEFNTILPKKKVEKDKMTLSKIQSLAREIEFSDKQNNTSYQQFLNKSPDLTIAHIENQIACSYVLNSTKELKKWTKNYIDQLTNTTETNKQERLEEAKTSFTRLSQSHTRHN
eukprot:TRINITY_DN9052_c0_g1_i1.p1 TRINITY_DN9052_c0_g1~~TRINITY_DN9052_c0_g1_i1.p1  ORF type:complete len:724 (+),score=124.37 TRINITY_DN9052_c0_g1_i1:84-2255(+)